jgi:hypothetical protein
MENWSDDSVRPKPNSLILYAFEVHQVRPNHRADYDGEATEAQNRGLGLLNQNSWANKAIEGEDRRGSCHGDGRSSCKPNRPEELSVYDSRVCILTGDDENEKPEVADIHL